MVLVVHPGRRRPARARAPDRERAPRLRRASPRSNGAATADTLACFAVGLFSFSAYLFTLRGFYAMQDTRTPFLLNCVENGDQHRPRVRVLPAVRRRRASRSRGRSRTSSRWSSRSAAMRRRLGRLEGRHIGRHARPGARRDRGARRRSRGASPTAIGYGTPGRAIVATVAALAVGGAGVPRRRSACSTSASCACCATQSGAGPSRSRRAAPTTADANPEPWRHV